MNFGKNIIQQKIFKWRENDYKNKRLLTKDEMNKANELWKKYGK